MLETVGEALFFAAKSQASLVSQCSTACGNMLIGLSIHISFQSIIARDFLARRCLLPSFRPPTLQSP